MDAFLETVSTVFQALINAGAYVMLPIIITIIGLVFRMNIGKAFKSGITITCGFVGINLLVNLLKSAVSPAASAGTADPASRVQASSALITFRFI